ncbi:MAG: hypothetical protein J0L99_02170 [Chitinophagales bacterium]|nr:hypothetical protein [Chitinophagales bacterium]
MKQLFFCTAASLSLSSCMPHYFEAYKEQPAESQVIYQHGVTAITRNYNGVDMTVALTDNGGSRLFFDVILLNNSDSNLTIFPEKVKAAGLISRNTREPYRVLSAERVIRNRNTAIALSGLALAAGTVAAASTLETPSNTVNTNNADVIIASTLISQAAIAPNGPVVANGMVNATPFMSRDGLARRHTLRPGEYYQGRVIIRRAMQHGVVEVGIPIDGEYQYFNFGTRQRIF